MLLLLLLLTIIKVWKVIIFLKVIISRKMAFTGRSSSLILEIVNIVVTNKVTFTRLKLRISILPHLLGILYLLLMLYKTHLI